MLVRAFQSISAALAGNLTSSEIHEKIAVHKIVKEASVRLGPSVKLSELNITEKEDLTSFYTLVYETVAEVAQKLRDVFKTRVMGLPSGDYSKPGIRFRDYTVSKLPWSNLSSLAGYAGCGNLILAQLTGASPYEIRRLLRPVMEKVSDNPENLGYDKEIMKTGGYITCEVLCAFLNLHGIQTIPITVRDLCPKHKLIENHLTKEHVVLTAMRVARDELTWCIYYQGHCYHGADQARPADCYDVLNNPVQEMYLLFNPSWRLDPVMLADTVLDNLDFS